MSVTRNREFDVAVLLSTPNTARNTSATAEPILAIPGGPELETVPLDLSDPSDFRAILTALRKEWAVLRRRFPYAEFSVSTASGTAQMHACWLLLVVRPPRHR